MEKLGGGQAGREWPLAGCRAALLKARRTELRDTRAFLRIARSWRTRVGFGGDTVSNFTVVILDMRNGASFLHGIATAGFGKQCHTCAFDGQAP